MSGNHIGKSKTAEYDKEDFLHNTIKCSIDVLAESDIDFEQEIFKLKAIDDRLENERFHLAVLGQFKRGKSTFVNALMGEEILPSSVLPLTSIPTYIQFGKQRSVEISFDDKSDKETLTDDSASNLNSFLARYVTESSNSKNHLNVSYVNVFYPSELLENGIVLIDTPGIGSVHEHNTEATLNFLPQCDAAIFVVSVDPPITKTEIDFLKKIEQSIPKLFFVLNKIDYLKEQDLTLSIEFLKKTLYNRNHANIDNISIYPVSALMGINAVKENDVQKLKESGIYDFKTELINFFKDKKKALLNEALQKKTDNILKAVRMKIDLAIKAQRMPLEEINNCLNLFNEKLSEVETQKVVASDLLSGDKRRLTASLEEYAEKLRGEARTYLKTIMKEAFAKNGSGEIDYDTIYNAVAEPIPSYFEHKFGELFDEFNSRITEILNRHNQKLNTLTQSVWQAATDIFSISYYHFEGSGTISGRYKPYWTTHKWDTSFTPNPEGMLEHFLPQKMKRLSIAKRVNKQIDLIVMHNVENLRFSLIQNINTLFASFAQTFDRNIEETISNIKNVISETVEKYKNRTESSEKSIVNLLKTLGSCLNI